MFTDRFKDYLNHLNIDFVRFRYVCGVLSAITVVICWSLFVIIGPNWGIDFTGGTEIHLRFEDDIQIEELREGLKEMGLSDDSVYPFGGAEAHEFKVRIQDATFGAEEAKNDVTQRLTNKFGADWIASVAMDAEVGARVIVTYKGDEVKPAEVSGLFTDINGVVVRQGSTENSLVIQLPGLSQEIQKAIGAALPDHTFTVLQSDSVGPKVGADLRIQGFLAVGATIALILVYLGFRFDVTFAPGAVVALVHDASVVTGVFVLMQKELNLSILGALMTIIGYSLNDTVIIYDRLRENREKYPRMPTKDLINKSVNETLTRTVSTSGATMLAISPFLVIGGPIIGDFSFAMFLGIIVGTYSTIYVASPLILVMEEIKPWLERVVLRNETVTAVSVATGGSSVPPVNPNSPDAPAAPMTESEKRRRERAEREKASAERTS